MFGRLKMYTEWVWPIQMNSTVHYARRLQILQVKDEKKLRELENDIPENCAHSLIEQQRTHHQGIHIF